MSNLATVTCYRDGEVRPDDPAVTRAMAVYDEHLTADERRNVFQALVRAAESHYRTGDAGWMTRFGESVRGMVRLHADPAFREAIRREPKAPEDPDDWVPVEKVIGMLRDEGGA